MRLDGGALIGLHGEPLPAPGQSFSRTESFSRTVTVRTACISNRGNSLRKRSTASEPSAPRVRVVSYIPQAFFVLKRASCHKTGNRVGGQC